MGYSVELMGLLNELSERQALGNVTRVADLGSQEIHFASQDLDSGTCKEVIRKALVSLGGKKISDEQLDVLANRSSTGDFYKLAGKEYKSFDADGWYGKPFDFNLDDLEDEDKQAYCLTVNGGTTEHLLDQRNAFKIMHELTKDGGLMIHQVPFLGSVDHGFFNYNPNFFLALARFNAYEVMGLWICPSGTFSLIPWSKSILKHLKAAQDPTLSVLLYCVYRKTNNLEFCIPFQDGYESQQDEQNLMRYQYNVDGRLVSGKYAVTLSEKEGVLVKTPGKLLIKELLKRISRRMKALIKREH